MGDRLAQGICAPQHPSGGHGKGTSQCLLSLGQGLLWAVECPTPCPVLPPPTAPGAGSDPPLPGLWGRKTSVGWGHPLRAVVAWGGGLKGGLFCLLLGCWGCWYFGSLNSSDLGGSRPWQAMNSYCPFSSPAEWEAGWLRRAGGTAAFPHRCLGTARCCCVPPLPSPPGAGLG